MLKTVATRTPVNLCMCASGCAISKPDVLGLLLRPRDIVLIVAGCVIALLFLLGGRGEGCEK